MLWMPILTIRLAQGSNKPAHRNEAKETAQATRADALQTQSYFASCREESGTRADRWRIEDSKDHDRCGDRSW